MPEETTVGSQVRRLLQAERLSDDLLQPHQVDGIVFMAEKVSAGHGCILAHSMGLGKSIQVITLVSLILRSKLQLERETTFASSARSPDPRKIIIVTPKSTVSSWGEEFFKWREKIPVLNVYNIQTTFDAARIANTWSGSREGAVLLLGHDLFSRLVHADFKSVDGELGGSGAGATLLETAGIVIMDEAHRIQKETSALAQALAATRTRRRICLTGYPLQNNVDEFWTLLNLVLVDVGDKEAFGRYFRKPVSEGHLLDSDEVKRGLMLERLAMLRHVITPVMHRVPDTVLRGSLPPFTQVVLLFDVQQTQRVTYNAAVSTDYPDVFSLLYALRRVLFHPMLVRNRAERCAVGAERSAAVASLDSDEDTDDISQLQQKGSKGQRWLPWRSMIQYPKLSAVHHLLELFVNQGEKTLVFSHSLECLSLLRESLEASTVPGTHGRERWALGKSFGVLKGSSTSTERAETRRLFASSASMRLLLISTRAGGVGITLTEASRIIMLDLAFNPCHDQQAIYRAYRLGQTRPVFVYYLVCALTAEEKIFARQRTKMWVFSKLFEVVTAVGNSSTSEVRKADVADLLEPLPDETTSATSVLKQSYIAANFGTFVDTVVSDLWVRKLQGFLGAFTAPGVVELDEAVERESNVVKCRTVDDLRRMLHPDEHPSGLAHHYPAPAESDSDHILLNSKRGRDSDVGVRTGDSWNPTVVASPRASSSAQGLTLADVMNSDLFADGGRTGNATANPVPGNTQQTTRTPTAQDGLVTQLLRLPCPVHGCTWTARSADPTVLCAHVEGHLSGTSRFLRRVTDWETEFPDVWLKSRGVAIQRCDKCQKPVCTISGSQDAQSTSCTSCTPLGTSAGGTTFRVMDPSARAQLWKRGR